MTKVYIDGHLMLRYSDSPADVYWKEISAFISGKYGHGSISEHGSVEFILLDSFQFIANRFKFLIQQETSLSFYLYVFQLHEESIKSFRKCMEQFLSRMGNEHDKILENVIESRIKAKGWLFARNIKSFKVVNGNNININNATAGEIDFIIVNETYKRIFVADSKYNRARYEAVGFRNDYSLFGDNYESKIEKKQIGLETICRLSIRISVSFIIVLTLI